jgi:hypothetical protein
MNVIQGSSRILNLDDFTSQKFEYVIHHLHDERYKTNVTVNVVG